MSAFEMTALAVGLFYLLWLLFVLTMRLRQLWKTLPMPAKILGAPPALAGFILDVLLNYTLCTLFFLRRPKGQTTITKRLHAYKSEGGKLGQFAGWLCKNLLNPFDPEHC